MPTHFTTFVCCCGAKTISGVSTTKPEQVVADYLKTQMGTKFDPVTKQYVTGTLNIMDAFVLWADPDRPDPPATNPYASSGKLLCQYIRTHHLGTVTTTPLRHNPMHPERKPGKMDLRIWIWNIDPAACQKWLNRRGKVKEKVGKRATPATVPPVGPCPAGNAPAR